MSINSAKNALKTYGAVNVQATAAYATPHRLILMLMDGALDKIAKAKGHMVRGEIKEKGSFISWGISIIGGLRASLDFEKGGEIAVNLEMLYDYMERKLVLANAENNVITLDEVSKLLSVVKDAWVKIGDSPEANVDIEQAAQSTVEDGNPNIMDSV